MIPASSELVDAEWSRPKVFARISGIQNRITSLISPHLCISNQSWLISPAHSKVAYPMEGSLEAKKTTRKVLIIALPQFEW